MSESDHFEDDSTVESRSQRRRQRSFKKSVLSSNSTSRLNMIMMIPSIKKRKTKRFSARMKKMNTNITYAPYSTMQGQCSTSSYYSRDHRSPTPCRFNHKHEPQSSQSRHQDQDDQEKQNTDRRSSSETLRREQPPSSIESSRMATMVIYCIIPQQGRSINSQNASVPSTTLSQL